MGELPGVEFEVVGERWVEEGDFFEHPEAAVGLGVGEVVEGGDGGLGCGFDGGGHGGNVGGEVVVGWNLGCLVLLGLL